MQSATRREPQSKKRDLCVSAGNACTLGKAHSCVQKRNHFSSPFSGLYEVSCRVTDHYSAGMRQRYRVNLCPQHKLKPTHSGGPTKIVQYFISAEEVEWDYSPRRDWEKENHNGTLKSRCVS